MPTKDLDSRTGRYTVAFRLPPEAGVEQAWLAGDFNGWSTEGCPMHREADGGMLAVVEDLEPGTELRFRYYLGDGAWENDWAADAYVDNEFGGADSLLVLPAVESPPPDVKGPGGDGAASNGSAGGGGAGRADGGGPGGGSGSGTSPIEAAAEAAPVIEAIIDGGAGAPDAGVGTTDPLEPPAPPAKKAAAKKGSATTSAGTKKATAKKSAPAKKAPAKKAGATKAATKKSAAKKATPPRLDPPPGTDSA